MTTDEDLKQPGFYLRGGVWQSRITIPLHLREVVPIKQTLRKSLKTGDRARALELHHEFQRECRSYFAAVQDKRRDPEDLPEGIRPKGLDVKALELAALIAIEARARDWEARGREKTAHLRSAEEVEDYRHNIEAALEAESEALDGAGETFQRALAEFLGASRLTPAQVPPRQREHIERLARDAAHLGLAVQEECLTDPDSRIRPFGRYRDTLTHRIRILKHDAEGRAAAPSMTLLEALSRWKANPKKAKGPTPSESAQRKTSHALRLLAQFVQGAQETPSEAELSQVRVADVDAVQANNFRNWLALCPLAPKSQSDKLNDIKTVFAAIERSPAKEMGADWESPWRHVRGIPFDNLGSRVGFSPSELARLFSQPIFQSLDGSELTQLEDRTAADRFAFYWIPILGLFTGSRVSELCQLSVEDIAPVEDHRTGEQVLSMLHRLEEPTGREQLRKTFKTGAARRRVPLTQRILELGFLEYVADVKASGHTTLFPALKRGKEQPGDRFGSLFRRFAERLGFASSLEGMHAFRHTLAGELRAAEKASSLHISYLTGHVDKGSVQVRYAHLQNYPATLRAQLDAVTFPTVKLPRLYQRGMAVYPPPAATTDP